MKFSTNIKLPGQADAIRVWEARYQDLIALQKFILNGNVTDIEFAVNELVAVAVQSRDIARTLSAFEKTIVLMLQRTISANAVVNIKLNEEVAEIYKLNVSSLISTLLQIPITHQTVIADRNFEYLLTLPQSFRANVMADYHYSTIAGISTNGNYTELRTMLPAQREAILKNIPAHIYPKLVQFTAEIDAKFAAHPINLPIFAEPLVLSTNNGILLEIVKLCCTFPLTEMYQRLYIAVSKGGIDMASALDLSMAEIEMYNTLIASEVTGANADHSPKSPGIPIISGVSLDQV